MKINRKKKIAIVLISLLGIIIWSQYLAQQRGKKLFRAFNGAKIESTLKKDSYIIHKGSGITLDNNVEYVFYPYTNRSLNQDKIFNCWAKKGDKIVKDKYSDTLYLIKGNKVFKYTFNKLR